MSVGELLGKVLGSLVGDIEGVLVGTFVGVGEGIPVGAGLIVGCEDIEGNADTVGEAVTASKQNPQACKFSVQNDAIRRMKIFRKEIVRVEVRVELKVKCTFGQASLIFTSFSKLSILGQYFAILA